MAPNHIENDVAEIKDTVRQIFKILNGNGQVGLCTKVALHEQRITDLPSPSQLKWYAAIGGGVVMVLGLVGAAVVAYFFRGGAG